MLVGLLWIGRAGCQLLYGGLCTPPVISMDTVEARLRLSCRNVYPEDDVFSLASCRDSMRPMAPAYAGRGLGYRFVGEVQWVQPELRFAENSPQDGFWWDKVDSVDHACDTRPGFGGSFCRYMKVCEMEERVWAKVNGGDALVDLSTACIADMTYYGARGTRQCLACPAQKCRDGDAVCPNGRVSAAPLPVFLDGFGAPTVISKPSCDVSCSAGTFLTCKTGSQCYYQVISEHQQSRGAAGLVEWFQYNYKQLGSDVSFVFPPTVGLVGDCYPCLLARGMVHLGRYLDSDYGLLEDGYLEYQCRGGPDPPERCAQRNQVTRVDPATNRTGACGCRPGYYYSAGSGSCAACPPGFKCAWQGTTPPTPVECENDAYSTGGASECRPCDKNLQCRADEAATRCLQSGGQGKYQTRNAYCTSCINCIQLSGPSGTVPCASIPERLASAA